MFTYDEELDELVEWMSTEAFEESSKLAEPAVPSVSVYKSASAAVKSVKKANKSALALKDHCKRIELEKKIVHQKLLAKYSKDLSVGRVKLISWSTAIPIGWPENVIFYNRSDWTSNDLDALWEKMGEIKFVYDWRPYKMGSSEQKRDLVGRLRAIAANKPFDKLPWKSFFKKQFPQLHLTSCMPEKWNGRDIMTVRTLLSQLEENEEEGRAIAFENRVLNIEADLLEKFSVVIGKFSSRIEWSKVQVVGWPKKVLFYDSALWTAEDVKLMERAVTNVNFIRTFGKSRSASYKCIPMRRFFASLKLKKGDTIDWQVVKEKYPGIHFTTDKISEWKKCDIDQIKQFLSDVEVDQATLEEFDFGAEVVEKAETAEKLESCNDQTVHVDDDSLYLNILQDFLDWDETVSDGLTGNRQDVNDDAMAGERSMMVKDANPTESTD